MSQSFSVTYVHLVFSTKERVPFLRDNRIREEMFSYLGGVSKELGCPTIVVGGFEDHVHILAKLGRTITIANWVKELKRVSSVWIKTKAWEYKDFSWQSGSGDFSVSQSNLAEVEKYIRTQEEHHRKTTFQEEYRRLLERHNLTPDERYVWE